MNKTFRVSGRLAVRLGELGVSVQAVLRRAGLPQDFFEQTRVLVNTSALFALWRAIAEISKDSAIGLKLGTESRMEVFHPSALAALSTESFGAAIGHMARYKQLTCPEEIVHEVTGDEWPIQFRWVLAVDSEPHALIEYCFAWLHTIVNRGAGCAVVPLRVELVQPRQHVRALERHFGCPVVGGASRNAMVYRASDRDRAFVTRNAELLEMLAPQFDQQLQDAQHEDTFVELVRNAIQQRLAGHRPGVDDVARGLHMSSRTLQRRLQDAGFSYQRVLDEARHQMARYYLANSVLELTEAAYLLGYEDCSSSSPELPKSQKVRLVTDEEGQSTQSSDRG